MRRRIIRQGSRVAAAGEDLDRLGPVRMLGIDSGENGFDRGLDRGQRRQHENRSRVVGDRVGGEDEIQRAEVLAVDAERVQRQRVADLRHGGRVLRRSRGRKGCGHEGQWDR